LYLNASSVDAAPIWGAFAQNIILRQFFSGVSGTNEVNLNIAISAMPKIAGMDPSGLDSLSSIF